MELCREFPGRRVLVALHSRKEVTDTINQFRAELVKARFEGKDLGFDTMVDLLVFKNGSEIVFRSANQIPRGGAYHKVLHVFDDLPDVLADGLYSVARLYPDRSYVPSSFNGVDKAVKSEELEDTSAMEAWLKRFPVKTV